jgi:hypothetical protein
MPSHVCRLSVVSLLTALAAGACSGGDDDTLAPYNCEAEDRDEVFTAGMEKTGTGGMTFTLESSTPAPPGRDNNTWVVFVETPEAAPFEGTVEVTPFMPDHRHGTPIEAVVTPVEGEPGRYNVAPVNLWMPGLWEITVEAQPTPTTRDSVVFRFCITG